LQKIRLKQNQKLGRPQNAGKVMQEILNVPDDIPQDLIDKARYDLIAALQKSSPQLKR
jgi:hypothetical protein